MREPCPQQVFGGCDPATCDRQCSATIIIPPEIEAVRISLAGPFLVGAILALGFLSFIAAANAGLSRAEHDYQVSRRI